MERGLSDEAIKRERPGGAEGKSRQGGINSTNVFRFGFASQKPRLTDSILDTRNLELET